MINENNFITADLIIVWAKSSLAQFENDYLEFKTLRKNSKSKNSAIEWDIYIITSSCGILLTASSNIDEKKSIKKALTALGENYIRALNEYHEFIDDLKLTNKSENEIWEKLGHWLLTKIKNDTPTANEINKLSLPLGNLVKTISFGSNGARKIEKNDDSINEKTNESTHSNQTKKIIILVGLFIFALYIFSVLREPSEFECMKLGSDTARDICIDEYHPTNGKKYYWSKSLYNEIR